MCGATLVAVSRGSRNDEAGWFSSKTLLWIFVPGIGVQRAQQGQANGLETLRMVFTSFATAILMIGVVVAFLASGGGTGSGLSPVVVAAGVAGFGLVSLVAPRLLQKPLDCASRDALVGSYRTRFFVRLAMAQAASLVGFVGFLLSGRWWTYPLGATFSVIGFLRLAPNSANLRRDQEELSTAGCALSLADALSEPLGHERSATLEQP